MALEITDTNVDSLLKDNKIVVIDFWAPWCGPCRMLGPIIEELAKDNQDSVVGKLNVDDNGNTAVKYGIRGIPAVLFFKNGELVDKQVGVTSKASLQAKIDALSK